VEHSTLRAVFHPDTIRALQAHRQWRIPESAQAFPSDSFIRQNNPAHMNLLHDIPGPDALERMAPILREHALTRVTVLDLQVHRGGDELMGIHYDVVRLRVEDQVHPAVSMLRAALRDRFNLDVTTPTTPHVVIARVKPWTTVPFDLTRPMDMPVHALELVHDSGIIDVLTPDGRLLDYR